MNITINFDMDGTVFDLYNNPNWLEMLDNENEMVFEGNFLPEINICNFYSAVKKLSSIGITLNVITWLPMNATKSFNHKCAVKKCEWVNDNMSFISNTYCVPYGTPKHEVISTNNGIHFLIDDNKKVCQAWNSCNNCIAVNVNSRYTVVNALIDIYDLLK